jgi:hypothetical protein
MKYLIFLFPSIAFGFPQEKVEYICNYAGYYIASPLDKCLKEQYTYYQQIKDLNLTDKQYKNSLWYGERNNWRGEVVGIDFYKVLERAKYLSK